MLMTNYIFFEKLTNSRFSLFWNWTLCSSSLFMGSFPFFNLSRHIFSERSESQGSIFCDRRDIWTELY